MFPSWERLVQLSFGEWMTGDSKMGVTGRPREPRQTDRKVRAKAGGRGASQVLGHAESLSLALS